MDIFAGKRHVCTGIIFLCAGGQLRQTLVRNADRRKRILQGLVLLHPHGRVPPARVVGQHSLLEHVDL